MKGKVTSQTRRYDLEERLLAMASAIVDVVESTPASRSSNHIAGQLIRSGTSPAANYAEAQSAESRRDFIHKLKICLKELRETRIWLALLKRKQLFADEHVGTLKNSLFGLAGLFAPWRHRKKRRNMSPYAPFFALCQKAKILRDIRS